MIFKQCVSGTRIQNVIVIWDHRRMIWRQASLKMTFHKCLVKMHIELQRRSNHDEERRTDWHSILWWPLALRAIKKIAQMVLPETSLFSRWRSDDGSFPFSGLAMNGFTYPFDASLVVKEMLYFVLKNEAFVGSGKLVKWKRSVKSLQFDEIFRSFYNLENLTSSENWQWCA